MTDEQLAGVICAVLPEEIKTRVYDYNASAKKLMLQSSNGSPYP